MSSSLPVLSLADFGPGQDHQAAAHQAGRLFAVLHRTDPAHALLPQLHLDPADDFMYLFIHGGQEVTRFENLQVGTHEIPAGVVAVLLAGHYGSNLPGLKLRVCSCYGTIRRPGDVRSAVGALADLLPGTRVEGYHGLVHLDPSHPPRIRLGDAVAWDPWTGPYIVGPPGPWEPA